MYGHSLWSAISCQRNVVKLKRVWLKTTLVRVEGIIWRIMKLIDRLLVLAIISKYVLYESVVQRRSGLRLEFELISLPIEPVFIEPQAESTSRTWLDVTRQICLVILLTARWRGGFVTSCDFCNIVHTLSLSSRWVAISLKRQRQKFESIRPENFVGQVIKSLLKFETPSIRRNVPAARATVPSRRSMLTKQKPPLR